VCSKFDISINMQLLGEHLRYLVRGEKT
jgi:hypothetical protein